ncbi:hypothetical protein GCM10023149_09460 [Mucilaginibacter gynuensis]|uniref:YdhG-like domain-containing protein n=1 Tax=Mucilaginibacter gynuensis TaxID=1302236 RepID=A0ABP8FYG0_9SPHI
MAKKAPETVDELIQKLDHPRSDVVNTLRQIILGANAEIAEQVKWNSPSFYYTGDMPPFDPKEYKRDLLVLNLHKKEYVLLVFPTGAKITDTTGLLEGKFPDARKVAKINSIEEAEAKREALQQVVNRWIELVDK